MIEEGKRKRKVKKNDGDKKYRMKFSVGNVDQKVEVIKEIKIR